MCGLFSGFHSGGTYFCVGNALCTFYKVVFCFADVGTCLAYLCSYLAYLWYFVVVVIFVLVRHIHVLIWHMSVNTVIDKKRPHTCGTGWFSLMRCVWVSCAQDQFIAEECSPFAPLG